MIFSLAKWVAKEVTGPKNVDKKIFIVGPAGSGKSMTGLALAWAVAREISKCNHDGSDKFAGEYFSFDPDHIAVINTDDLIKLMTAYPKKNSVRIIDDCGASIGFTSRRSMSRENLDLVSIYGTNRVRNCVTIICVQDTNFTDLRMRMLANVIIDLREYYQVGPLRMAKLWSIKMDDAHRGGWKKCRFMTYVHDQWTTIESIACFMPPDDLLAKYNTLREQKDRENTEMLSAKYNKPVDDKVRCPKCASSKVWYRKKYNNYVCKCGWEFSAPEYLKGISKKIEA